MSILPNLSKIKINVSTIVQSFWFYFSPKQCSFCKGHSAKYCLMVLLEKFKEPRDRGDEFGGFNHWPFYSIYLHRSQYTNNWKNLVLGNTKSLNLIFSYLRNRMQSVTINSKYSNKCEIIYGVPQGSLLGPLLFNIQLKICIL